MGRLLASPESVGALAARIGAEIRGDAQIQITSVSSLTHASSGDLSFFSDKKFANVLAKTRARAIIAPANAVLPANCVHIVHANPHQAFADLLSQLFTSNPDFRGASKSDEALSIIGLNNILAHADSSIGLRSQIGTGSVLHAGVRIGNDVRIGANCVLYPNVVVMDGVVIGDRCIVQPGAVIGSDGFGFQPTTTGWMKVPQVGTVIIGNDVEIGANTSIDRGAIDDTVIGDGVKIDNLVQIAHNVRIGDHTAIAGCAGVAGSAVIGKRCMIGGAAMIVGHIEIADDVIVSGGTLVADSIKEKGRYTGVFPTTSHRDWMRVAAGLRRGVRPASSKDQDNKHAVTGNE